MENLANSAPPLDEHQGSRLRDAVAGLSPAQLQWVSGYAAGLAAAGNTTPLSTVAPAAEPSGQLTILYGSQTGNGESVAHRLAEQASERGYATRVISLADFRPTALKRESLVTFVISTHGEGDPPDDAELFHEYLLSHKAPQLPGLRFSVLALGDSSYVNFCQTGREFDTRLEELGATRFEPLVECDLDFEEPSRAWSTRVVDRMTALVDAPATAPVARLQAVARSPAHGRENPFEAEVLVNQKITGAGSDKDVRHIELSLEGSDLVYEPGDSLAVIASNPPQLVDEFLDVLGADGDAPVEVDAEFVALREALTNRLEITALSLGFLRDWAAAGNSDALHTIIGESDSAVLADFLASHQVIDVVRRYPANAGAEAFVGMLRKLSPRSYSIASSAAANPGEVHLTVAAVRYEAFGRPHWGAASTLLADRLVEGDRVGVFVEANPRFRLPAPDTPIVMIGPGTGIAPFRAFIEERVEQDARGDSWLFFGDRTAHDDFLYQLEWQRHLKQGHLTRLDAAFSRDQRNKVYVQDRMREQGKELYRWIERGAVLYVCGDAKHMAGDVETALLDVLVEHGELDRSGAEAYLKELRRARRYQRDIY
jgi:sulfite reductase (NADPH) flavoprotein alpha-component